MARRKGVGDEQYKTLHGESIHDTRERETQEESSYPSPRKQSSPLSASDQKRFHCSIKQKHQSKGSKTHTSVLLSEGV